MFGNTEKGRKQSPAARVFYISFVFSNACRVLSQCNTRLRLRYLLIMHVIIKITISSLTFDWFKKVLFSTNSFAKLLSDSLLSDSSTNQSNSKL